MGAVAPPSNVNSNTERKEKPQTVMGNFVTPVKKQAPPTEVKGDVSRERDENI